MERLGPKYRPKDASIPKGCGNGEWNVQKGTDQVQSNIEF